MTPQDIHEDQVWVVNADTKIRVEEVDKCRRATVYVSFHQTGLTAHADNLEPGFLVPREFLVKCCRIETKATKGNRRSDQLKLI